jgi:protein SCO1/2
MSTLNMVSTMVQMTRLRKALLLSTLGVLLALPPSLAIAHSTEQHAETANSSGAGYTRTVHSYRIPSVTLEDSAGTQLSLLSALETGGPVMMNFIFTSCAAVCPVLSATFSQAQKQLGSGDDDVHMVSISIDPEHDTAERLREYAARFGAGPNWRFLTGNLDDIIKVQRAFGAYRGDKTNHIPLTYLRTAAHAPWVRLEGFTSAADLVREYRALKP